MTAPTTSVMAALLQGFFTDRLAIQRQASGHTIAAYRDAVRLLLIFASHRHDKQPAELSLGDLDADTIAAFLTHLETNRRNSAATRNARLAVIHSFYRYAMPKAPEHALLISQVLAIPLRRRERAIVSWLNETETEALIAAPDRSTWHGRRDHALLLLTVQTGLRVAELTSLTCDDVTTGPGAAVRCHGKGRKDRATPLAKQTAAIIDVWLHERGGPADAPLFPTRRGTRMSTDAVERLVAKHAATAAHECPSIKSKTVTPHTLRHTAAMALLHAGVDTSVIALWLGHEDASTTQIYLHADMTIKENALALVTTPNTTPGRYQPPDQILTFLENL